MSRAHRASTAAVFTYVQFALATAVGLVLVPFVLDRVGVRLYGYWLASGEVLAYAAMADLGMLGVVPWMIAEADGRRDRDAIKRLVSTGFCAAVIVSLLYLVLVVLLWNVAPAVLKLSADERAAIAGPLALMAAVTAVVLPLRIAGSVLTGLQDVKFYGALATIGWAVDVVLTISLLLNGYGLYALAIGASVPSLVTAAISIVRLRAIGPDLLTSLPMPSGGEVRRLFREGLGGWLGAWGWRLTAASDAIVVASLGAPAWITMLAMTSKLGHVATQMSWVPGDSGLVGLANLSGEGERERVRAAVTAVFRVYLTLVGAGACAVLAVNGAFVGAWVGPGLFAGAGINTVLAGVMIVATTAHGAAAVASVLGRRLHVGLATLASGAVQVALALVLGRQLGLIGVPLAALCAQVLVLLPSLLVVLPSTAGVTMSDLGKQVFVPWAMRSVPLLVLCAIAGPFLGNLSLAAAIPAGAVIALLSLWMGRRLILDYAPVAAVIRARLAVVRLDGLIPLAGAEPPRVP
jgi:O-antigen/teichoic acid export membrane protein